MEAQAPGSLPSTSSVLTVLGAVVGGVIGHFAFLWIARQGFYALVLPGALAGLGGGFFVKQKSIPLAVVCGGIALATGIFSEWRFRPFIADSRLGYFMTHLHQLHTVTLIMIALGGLIGFWFALGRTPQRPSLLS
jgi:hypothetical protein